jgi:DNA-binding CsgD family transcriptional regulator
MNTSIAYSDLHPAEREVADLYAWGMTKKEIATQRGKSVRTIENQIRKLFEKSGVRKDTEFTSWYFCSRFKISFDLSPLTKAVVTGVFLVLIGINMLNDTNCIRSTRSIRIVKTVKTSSRKNEII